MNINFIFKAEKEANREACLSKFKLSKNDYNNMDKILNYNITILDNVISVKKDSDIITGTLQSLESVEECFGLDVKKEEVLACYNLDFFAGGRFVFYKDGTSELTCYGSGVPIIYSYLGSIQNN